VLTGAKSSSGCPGGRISKKRGIQVHKDMTQMAAEAHGLRPGQIGRLMGAAGQLLVVAVLAVAFFIAPALQGINLEADQSSGANAVTRAADAAAAQEASRLVGRR
jgi:hypothetical protein